jgi:alpha/beta superfamily hydrolase
MPKVYISSAIGKIEGMYHPPKASNGPIILLLHPHSLYGGTMNNKIIFNLFKLFVSNGFGALRINFRGVGKSDGHFDNGFGEVADASIALNWLKSYNVESQKFYILGFSFGAYVAMQIVSRRPEIERFLAISPPISKYNFEFFNPCLKSGLIIQGSSDAISKVNDTTRFVNSLKFTNNAHLDYKVIDKADHFFTGSEVELYKYIELYLSQNN